MNGTAATGRSRPLLGAALVVSAAVLWGSLGLFGRLAFARGVTPAELASIRAALAFIFALPLLAFRPAAGRIRGRDLPLLLAYGSISVGLFYWIYLAAVDRLPLAVAAALLYTAPAFVVAIAWAMGWEPVRHRRLIPLVMVLTGAVLVTGAWRAVGEGTGGMSPVGMALGVGSGLAYALYTALGKRIRGRYDALTTILWAYGIGAAVLAIVAPPWDVVVDHPSARLLILLMAFGPTFLAAVAFFVGLRHIDASTASMLATIEPVVAALLGVAWLGEGVGVDTVVGIGLIVGAAVWLARRV